MDIGRVIFYDKITGSKLIDTGEWKNVFKEKTVDEQIASYKELSELNRDSFDYIKLSYGQYSQDFSFCTSFRVNPETKELEFSYPDPNEPEVPPVYQKPLSVEIEELKTAQAATDTTLLELMESILI